MTPLATAAVNLCAWVLTEMVRRNEPRDVPQVRAVLEAVLGEGRKG